MIEFIHEYIPSTTGSSRTFLALHGTGGDEQDMLNLVKEIDPDAAYLSPRGKSTDEGLNRYFRRHGEGVFDVDDIKMRTGELAQWVEWAKKQYALKQIVIIGYSNGANIGTALLFTRPELVDGFIGLRGMTPYTPGKLNLKDKLILLINGISDPIVPNDDVNGLAEIFRKAGGDVEHVWLRTGHNLVREDVANAQNWLNSR